MINYKDFQKLDLRTGKVIKCEDILKSKNLLKLTVDIGEKKTRTIVAGIKNEYNPEEMKNKKIIVLTNLKPIKLMGIQSQGMILAADVENKPILLKIDEKNKENAEIGSKIH